MPKIKKSKRIAERRAGLQESHQEAHVNEQHPKEHPVSSNRDGCWWTNFQASRLKCQSRTLQWTHVKHVCISAMWKNARVVLVQKYVNLTLYYTQFEVTCTKFCLGLPLTGIRVNQFCFLHYYCNYLWIIIEQFAIWTFLQVMHLFYILSNLKKLLQIYLF